MQTSPTNSAQRGFTLIELMVALVVVSILSVMAVPSLQRMNESMRYREAVRDIVNAVKTARRDAQSEGRAYDLLIDLKEPAWVVLPADQATRVFADADITKAFPEELQIDATTALEVSPGRGVAGIRFYASGGASGGDVDLVRANGEGVRIKVDWLLGEIVQVPVSAQ